MESQIIRLGHLTAHQTAHILGITLGGVRAFVHRGEPTRSGGSSRQPWYKIEGVDASTPSTAPARPLDVQVRAM
ncbi:hypothetical protein ABZ819_11365 [Streptomyces venezuelae]|uniref:hypothetical protein n=1 Tax=Streptomyces venezuelae TaxID=54571 RepID=UPI003443FE51